MLQFQKNLYVMLLDVFYFQEMH